MNNSSFTPLPPHNYDQSIYVKNMAQKIYKSVADDVSIMQNKFLGWCLELGENICEDVVSFGKMHKEIYGLTNVAKYRSFQYRLLQRSLVTNVLLYKWGIKVSDSCSFCGHEKRNYYSPTI